MAKTLIANRGSYFVKSNEESTRNLYYKKTLYKAETQDLATHVIDFTYGEKFLYGRVDRYFTPIVLNKKAPIVSFPNSGVSAFDFVVGAFNDMNNHFKKDNASGRLTQTPFLSHLEPVNGYLDPEKHYQDYIESLTQSLKKRFETRDIKVLNFEQFINDFKNTMFTGESIRIKSFTKTAFIKNRMCPINSSGLVVEIADLNFSNDLEKIQSFIESPNWDYYVNACNEYGFMIDRNAPWRLVADITSEGMQNAMARHHANGMNALDKFFASNYKFVHTGYYINFVRQLLNLYNGVKKAFYSVQQYCELTNKIVPKIITPKQYTVRALKKDFSEIYFLRLYFELRVKEEESSMTDIQKTNFINEAINLYKSTSLPTALTSFERTLNRTFDYNGSMGYHIKAKKAKSDMLQESVSGDTTDVGTGVTTTTYTGGATGGGGGGY